MKLTIDHQITVKIQNDGENHIEKLLIKLLKLNENIMSQLSDLKDKLAISDQKIDLLTGATAGVTKDVAFIKAKLDANPNGIDAAGVAELSTTIDLQNEKLTALAQSLSDLDASTDSTEV